jgi:hypothetical protein
MGIDFIEDDIRDMDDIIFKQEKIECHFCNVKMTPERLYNHMQTKSHMKKKKTHEKKQTEKFQEYIKEKQFEEYMKNKKELEKKERERVACFITKI